MYLLTVATHSALIHVVGWSQHRTGFLSDKAKLEDMFQPFSTQFGLKLSPSLTRMQCEHLFLSTCCFTLQIHSHWSVLLVSLHAALEHKESEGTCRDIVTNTKLGLQGWLQAVSRSFVICLTWHKPAVPPKGAARSSQSFHLLPLLQPFCVDAGIHRATW